MSSGEIVLGMGLTLALAVACQIVAGRWRLPAIVLLLPVGFVGGQLVPGLDLQQVLGEAFTALVGLAVAVILFDGGLELVLRELEGHSQRVVRRLLTLGIPITWAGAALLAAPLLGLPGQAAIMLGAILIVSGPTVVGPLLDLARPGRRVGLILSWEGATIDPLGAILGAVTFQALAHHESVRALADVGEFVLSIGVGLLGGVAGAALLWFLLGRLRLSGILATEAVLASVVFVAATCNAVREDTGLIAAIVMGVAVANLPAIDMPEDRRFFRTIVQLIIGVLFISISATVTVDAVRSVLGPALVLIAGLVLVVRPVVAAVSTWRTSLELRERIFIAWMDPRGIVAASTAATFAAPLAAAGVVGAEELLPTTFVVIVGTVTLYGVTAVPLSRLLGLADLEDAGVELPDEPELAPPPSDE